MHASQRSRQHGATRVLSCCVLPVCSAGRLTFCLPVVELCCGHRFCVEWHGVCLVVLVRHALRSARIDASVSVPSLARRHRRVRVVCARCLASCVSPLSRLVPSALSAPLGLLSLAVRHATARRRRSGRQRTREDTREGRAQARAHRRTPERNTTRARDPRRCELLKNEQADRWAGDTQWNSCASS